MMVHLSLDSMIASACFACRGVFIFALLAAFQVGCSRSPAPIAEPVPEPQQTRSVAKVAERVPEPLPDKFDGVPADDLFEVSEPASNFAAVSISKGASSPINSEPFVIEGQPSAPVGNSFAIVDGPDSKVESGGGALKFPPGFGSVPGAKRGAGGLPSRIRCEFDGSEMVLVTGGESVVGTNSGPPEAQPMVSLVVDSFYVGVTEIRVAQYLEIRRKHLGKGTGMSEPVNATAPADYPVTGVTWGDARNYAVAVGCELPTEAQWEKAARGRNGFSHPWGESRPLWTAQRSLSQIDAVGSHAEDRSPFGVMDLAGNAREWVLDFFHEKAFAGLEQLAPERRRNWPGPRNNSATSTRVVKGNGADWKVWARQGLKMTDREALIGFRCVLNVPVEK